MLIKNKIIIKINNYNNKLLYVFLKSLLFY